MSCPYLLFLFPASPFSLFILSLILPGCSLFLSFLFSALCLSLLILFSPLLPSSPPFSSSPPSPPLLLLIPPLLLLIPLLLPLSKAFPFSHFRHRLRQAECPKKYRTAYSSLIIQYNAEKTIDYSRVFQALSPILSAADPLAFISVNRLDKNPVCD